MFATAVIGRELLEAARNPAHYRMRWLAGLAGTVLLQLMFVRFGTAGEMGNVLFGVIHGAAVASLLLFGPVTTADSLSKEKRGGTLDLLFLTPLTPPRVVTAKFVAGFVRLFSLWLVFIPLAIVPVLAGGLNARPILVALGLQFAVMLMMLTTGLLASALSRRVVSAVILAVVLGGLFLWTAQTAAIQIVELRHPTGLVAPGFVTVVGGATIMVSAPEASLFRTEWLQALPVIDLILQFAFVLVMAVLLLRLTAACLKKRDDPSEYRIVRWFRRTFLTPRYWTQAFRRSMNQKMDRNPLIWLEYRTAWSRVGRTALIALLIFAESWILIYSSLIQELILLHVAAAGFLLAIIAVTSATSFRREKETGAFELLLVAPMTEWSLLGGRLRAVWSYYFPVLLTLVALVHWTSFIGYEIDELGNIGPLSFYEADLPVARTASLACSVVTVPIAGLFYALRMKNLIPALCATLFVGIILPMFFWQYAGWAILFIAEFFPSSMWIDMAVQPIRNGDFPYITATVLAHAALCAAFLRRTYRYFRLREFA